MLGVEPAKRQVPHHAPYTIECLCLLAPPTDFAPDAVYLSLIIEAPDRAQFFMEGLREQLTVGSARVGVAEDVNHKFLLPNKKRHTQ